LTAVFVDSGKRILIIDDNFGAGQISYSLVPCHYYTFCYTPSQPMFYWIIAALLSCLVGVPAHASQRADLFRHAKAATALIVAINDSTRSVSMGSGFFINSHGLLLTNAHVIEGSTRLYLYVQDQVIHSAPEIVTVDPDLDLAALRVKQANIETLALATEMPSEGTDVIAVGYPRITDILEMGFALHATVGTGLVGGLAQGRSRTKGGVAEFVQTTGILNFGNSGGPLVDTETGEVVGMVVTTVPYLERAKDRTGASIASVTMRSGIGYSIPAPVIRQWLDSQRLVARPSLYRSGFKSPRGVEPEADRSFATGHFLYTIAMVFQHDADLLHLAVQQYETAIALRPEATWIMKSLGQAYAAMERWNDAVEAYSKALEQTPHDAVLLSDIGDAWERLGRRDRALELYRTAVGENPQFGRAHNNLGTLLWKMGQLDEAIGAFRRAVGSQPDLAAAVYNLGMALEAKGLSDEAVTVWESYLRNPESTPDTHEWTAKMREQLTRLRAASLGRTSLGTLANSAGALSHAR
jgi:tetratricopeptide (TPR) repeat protein